MYDNIIARQVIRKILAGDRIYHNSVTESSAQQGRYLDPSYILMKRDMRTRFRNKYVCITFQSGQFSCTGHQQTDIALVRGEQD